MTKTTQTPTTVPPNAIEIARRAARSNPADAGIQAGFAEHVGNTPGGANVIVPVTKIKALAPEVRVTLPRMLGSDAQGQAEAELATIASPADLGRLVRAVRERRDFSQQEFADLAGVGRRFLSELENGKPTLELGKVLKVTNAAGIVLFARER
ncbi:helix-turn-helix transcriptional regulator [Mesorhizobium sp. 10.2.3]|uniref:helix-turn-helix transcriptional regulator n=1 Tax=Mesorhizobium sp. 10.2.3 TaxID=1085775 RepID=UPI001FEDB963|nr:helix-turn-helix transcriptional regulator [Mesorhizobium sp. 10.2.3]